ncbi:MULTISPECIES: ABC transporter ATP-binding protein [unclassified Butyrivibrio]|uniref:ABC transporter ATP-binding protein n=1 Tax=unclassified Butyrivibrio TaxID=2639466 RepID=UPI0003B3EF34|nr:MULTISPECIES: ABC transporter ATP-binding protein [unclassified Butyrivibrio]MDC7293515.1 ABC transporter ATP-binding protein/permease [Butyrivibrio sp. DSM 10294]
MPGPGDRGKAKEKPKHAKKTMLRLLKYLMEYAWVVLLMLLCAFASNIGNLLGPDFAGKAINAASQGAGKVDINEVIRYGIFMLIAYVSGNILSFFVNIGMMRVGRKVARNMRRDVFNKLMEMPVGYFDRHLAGDIISRVSYDIDVVSTSLSSDVVQILTSFVTVVGSFVMMCIISPPLVLCMVFTIPVSILFTRYMSKRTRPLYRLRSLAYGEMNGFAEEMFTGQKTILAYAHEDYVCDRFEEINRNAAEAYRDADSLGMTMGPTIGMISNIGLAAIGLGGAMLYMNGVVGIGQISSFILYSRKFSGPINEISNIVNEIFSALAAAERVFQLLDEAEEVKDIEGAGELARALGTVEARDVDFGYLKNKIVLRNFNMKAEPGQTIAIVGHTGAGKTTIINLLMRFYDVNEGAIFVDEKEVKAYTLQSLRKNYSMVLQDTWVFNGTIFDNIAYGKENATMEEVVEAAKSAHIHNYIMRLPKGYNTVISEDGGNISKGQKQLITIARAMLYDTSMLILDEATSNVDTATERKVQKAMRSLMAGKTSFIIAHRLSTIRNADNILVVDAGNVVEQGDHDYLMNKKGAYYALYRSQFE